VCIDDFTSYSAGQTREPAVEWLLSIVFSRETGKKNLAVIEIRTSVIQQSLHSASKGNVKGIKTYKENINCYLAISFVKAR
jgi:hypothetical protein